MSLSFETGTTILFGALLVLELYLFALVFSSINEQQFRKFILLGPFALLIPGVLSRRGMGALGGVFLVTTAILVLGIDLFDINEVP